MSPDGWRKSFSNWEHLEYGFYVYDIYLLHYLRDINIVICYNEVLRYYTWVGGEKLVKLAVDDRSREASRSLEKPFWTYFKANYAILGYFGLFLGPFWPVFGLFRPSKTYFGLFQA